METHPVSYEDAIRIKKAAHFWAHHRRWRVRVNLFPSANGMKEVRVTLISKNRIRDYG